jgi:PPE-repeat protein
MKLTISIFLFLFCFFPFLIHASSNHSGNLPDLIEFEESEIYNAFNEIEEQVSYIQQNENLTYSDLVEAGISTDNITNKSSAVGAVEQFTFDSQTSFLMGCLFGGVGILAVALVNEGDTTALNS